ncbi:hypothetical protein SteCoe_9309 [Stentor coeruleus]|uniref:EF-hand domain-containing protein n=1 Tax=Stentor coeruleus TaxID=5963 RepID=A0A1R2CIB0_9CILI|nr:hypothetical protein SteCoe_9309 [Stentor coeruleus]
MKTLKSSKLYFNDLLELNERSFKSPWKRDLTLEKIDEMTEFSEDTIIHPPRALTTLKRCTPLFKDIYCNRTLFFKDFLSLLSKNHPKIYTYLINKAIDLELITHPKRINNLGKSKGVIQPNNNNENSIKSSSPDTSLSSDDEISEKGHQISIPVSKSARGGIFFKNSLRIIKKKLEPPQTASSSDSSSIYSLRSTTNTRFGILRKRVTLKSADPKLKNIFNIISDNKMRMIPEDFLKFLNMRYPVQVSESMLKFFNFKFWTYSDFITEMNKFITCGELKHLRFCFNIFDFDKDRKITFKDAFTAMEIRKSNHYDDDIILITDMFELKREGKLKKNKEQNLIRRKSTFGLINDTLQKYEPIPVICAENMQTKLTINFKEFCTIRFNGRPQILQDFFLYVCKYNYMIEKGFIERSPLHSTKTSETIVMEMNLNPDFNEKISKNDKYDYYCALDASMRLFQRNQLEDMLKKFKFLMSDEKFKIKVITKDSMIEKLPKLLGYKNDYLAIRLYQVFSQNKDLSKSTFLFKINSLINGTTSFTINRFAFDLYDTRTDGKLTVDEIYKMYEALPISSKAFQECNVMVEMYIQSIFERVREKLNQIEFAKFVEVVDVSCLGLEFIEMFRTPFEMCFGRVSQAFQTTVVSSEETKKYYETKSSLLSIIG